jgi:hypothetical protein
MRFSFLSGHEFTRAENANKLIRWALAHAPSGMCEVTFSPSRSVVPRGCTAGLLTGCRAGLPGPHKPSVPSNRA